MRFNIIGAGRLGKNIALALSHAEIAVLHSIANLSLTSGKLSCDAIGSGTAVEKIEDLPAADITWITTNDDSIQPIVSLLAARALLKPGSFVIHCSGVLNSKLLEPLKKMGCHISSFHPLKAFKTGYLDSNAFLNVECIAEGDEKVCAWLKDSFTRLGAHVMRLNPEAKAGYHAAACIASNYLITLASCSEHLLLNAGFTSEQARIMLVKLMQGNLDNLKASPSIADALTGPLMRGDTGTLSLHLAAIDNPLFQDFYKAAGLATLPLTQLTDDKKKLIMELLAIS